MKKAYYICACPEGYLIKEKKLCPICGKRFTPISGKTKGYWTNPRRDAEFFVLKVAGWKTIEIAEKFGVSVDAVRRANKKYPNRALNYES